MEKLLIKTPDLELASTLNYLGFDILGISQVPNSKQYTFLFEPSTELNEAIERIRNRVAKNYYQFEPLELLFTRKNLLQRLKETNYGN